jgi:hypothetical protein
LYPGFSTFIKYTPHRENLGAGHSPIFDLGFRKLG